MRIFLAFSTGKMLGAILSKLLKKNVDVSNIADMKEIQEKNPEKLEEAQELVKKGGDIENFINDMTENVDSSYKNQFINWLWTALASDDETFETYIWNNYNGSNLVPDTHLTTGLTDKINSFCRHLKDHAFFRDRCSKIMKQINASPNHMPIASFMSAVLKMDEEWDKQKKFLVTDDTVEKAWRKIEENRIELGEGKWGDFIVYKVPGWYELMQTCHERTEWCVAKKGDSGKNFYIDYGDPYYLVCKGARNPYALLNPPSQQFKGIDDRAILPSAYSESTYKPSQLRLTLLCARVLEVENCTRKRYGKDLEVLNQINQIESDIEVNDNLDYNKMTDQLMSVSDNPSDKKQVIDELPTNGELSFDTILNLNGSSYKQISSEKKQRFFDELVSGSRNGISIFSHVFDTCLNNAQFVKYIMPMIEKGIKVDGSSVIDYMGKNCFDYRFKYFPEEARRVCAEVARKYFGKCNKEGKDEIIEWAMVSDYASNDLVREILGKTNLLSTINRDNWKTIWNGCESGKLTESTYRQLENYIIKVIRDEKTEPFYNFFSNLEERLGKSTKLSNEFKNELYPLLKARIESGKPDDPSIYGYSNNHSQIKAFGELIKKGTSEIAENERSRMENEIQNNREDFVKSLVKVSYNDFNNERNLSLMESDHMTDELFDKVVDCACEADMKSYRNNSSSLLDKLMESKNMTQERFDRLMKKNPRLVIICGWKSPFCTKERKLALVKAVAKKNGKIFEDAGIGSENEDKDVQREYFKTRILGRAIAPAYNFLNSIKSENSFIDDDTARFVLAHVSIKKDWDSEQMIKHVLDGPISDSLKEEIYNHLDGFKENSDEMLKALATSNPPLSVLKEMVASKQYDAIYEWIRSRHSNNPEAERYLIEQYEKNPSEYESNKISYDILMRMNNCPKDFFRKYYYASDEKSRVRMPDSYEFQKGVKKGMFTIDEVLDEFKFFISKEYHTGSSFNDIMAMETVSDKDKAYFISHLVLDSYETLDIGTKRNIADYAEGDEMFKKIFDYVKNHNNGDEVEIMQDLMMNENYNQKQLEPLCFFHENEKVLAEYVKRFGINDRIKNLRFMSDVVNKSTTPYSKVDLSARDLKVLLTSNDEDTVWMAKKLIKNRYNTAVQRNVLSSRMSADLRFSRILSGVTMKVAKGVMTDTIAIRIARSVTEE